MSEICNKCGLPKELCACGDIAKETQSAIKLYTDKRRYGKYVTIIEGVEQDSADGDLGAFAKELKSHCACGGTVKDGKIELQGNHIKKVKEKLANMGFSIGK
jgi:translation initiation factor 1